MQAVKIVEVYYKLVKAGSRTLSQVPYAIQADVKALIDADIAQSTTQGVVDNA